MARQRARTAKHDRTRGHLVARWSTHFRPARLLATQDQRRSGHPSSKCGSPYPRRTEAAGTRRDHQGLEADQWQSLRFRRSSRAARDETFHPVFTHLLVKDRSQNPQLKRYLSPALAVDEEVGPVVRLRSWRSREGVEWGKYSLFVAGLSGSCRVP